MSEMTLDQRRAQYAWHAVREVPRTLIEKQYTALAKAAPSLIMNSGLMQTLAFLQAKDAAEHRQLLAQLCKWLGRTLGGQPLTGSGRFPRDDSAIFATVMPALQHSPSSLYMRATGETMALLRWIRQFADARKTMPEDE